MPFGTEQGGEDFGAIYRYTDFYHLFFDNAPLVLYPNCIQNYYK
jgi:hypothetical protein